MNIKVSKRRSFRLSPLVSLFLLPLSPVQQKYLSLEGYTPAKMAAVAAAPQAHSTFLGLTENPMSLKRQKPFVGSGA